MYTEQDTLDARYDYEQLHGELCPKHGNRSCGCCKECGRSLGKKHLSYCNNKDEDEDEDYQSPETD